MSGFLGMSVSGRLGGKMRELLEVMGVFIILIVVMVSQIYTYVKTH